MYIKTVFFQKTVFSPQTKSVVHDKLKPSKSAIN